MINDKNMPARGGSASRPGRGSPKAAGGKKILIVEDERDLRQALVDKFTHEGFDVFEAENGEKGLKVALKEHPDLILLDIIMPVMDGITMMEKMCEDKWGQDVPVIMLTNLTDIKRVSEAVESGVYEYLVKSDWKIEDVVKRVREKLGIS